MGLTDREAVEKTAAGCPEAFETLIERYSGSLSALAYDRLGNVHDAQDAVQETFLEAFRRIRELREPDRFPAWTYAILRAISAQRIRRLGIERRGLDGAETPREGTWPLTPLETAELDERQRLLREAVATLTPALREIVTLRYLSGADRREAAALLDITPETADKRLERALADLRDRLRKTR